MFERVKRIKRAIDALVELPEKLAALEERVKQLESPNWLISPSSSGTSTIITSPLRVTWPMRCTDGCRYPFPWHATVPANCEKCGLSAENPFGITYTVETSCCVH